MYTGDGVGVMIDTENGNFSFALDGVNLGVAYERISLSYLASFFIEAVILWSSWFETEESVLFFHLTL